MVLTISQKKLIPLIISRALNDEELPVYGTGENVRDWYMFMITVLQST